MIAALGGGNARILGLQWYVYVQLGGCWGWERFSSGCFSLLLVFPSGQLFILVLGFPLLSACWKSWTLSLLNANSMYLLEPLSPSA